MKKLYEIEDYLKKKVAITSWVKTAYIYFKNGVWYDHNDDIYPFDKWEIEDSIWYEYEEPKKEAVPIFRVIKEAGNILDTKVFNTYKEAREHIDTYDKGCYRILKVYVRE